MSEQDPEPDPFPWLPIATVLAWLKVDLEQEDEGSTREQVIDDCRKAACNYIEDQRPDLLEVDTEAETTTFVASNRIKLAGLILAARLVARQDSPNGIVAFEELGSGSLVKNDPDLRRLIARPFPVLG